MTSQNVSDSVLGKGLRGRILIQRDLSKGLPFGRAHSHDNLHAAIGDFAGLVGRYDFLGAGLGLDGLRLASQPVR